MIHELESKSASLKRGINKVKVKMKMGGQQYEAILYVNGPYRRKPLPFILLDAIYGTMNVAVGEGPYRINALTSCLSRATHAKYPGKVILVYRALFSSMRLLTNARNMWKAQFSHRTIEAWFPREEEKPNELISYHCIWVGEDGEGGDFI